jgi:hypothetical protein
MLYKLYLITEPNGESYNEAVRILKDDQDDTEVRNELGITIDFNPTENQKMVIGENERWENGPAFKATISGVKELLKLKSNTQAEDTKEMVVMVEEINHEIVRI